MKPAGRAMRQNKQFKCLHGDFLEQSVLKLSQQRMGDLELSVSLCVFFWHARLLLFSYVFVLSGPDRFLGGMKVGGTGFLGGNMWCDPARSFPVWERHKSCVLNVDTVAAPCGKTIGGIPGISEPHHRDVQFIPHQCVASKGQISPKTAGRLCLVCSL